MTIDTKNWSGNIAGVGFGGPMMHTYSSSDTLATIAGSGYFNSVADEITTGDVIYVYSSAASGGGGKMYRMTRTVNTVTLTALS